MEKLLASRLKAAKKLDISVKTLDKLAKFGKLQKVRIGSRVYFNRKDLEAFSKKGGTLC